LNSITGPSLIPEIQAADTYTVIGGPMPVHVGMNCSHLGLCGSGRGGVYRATIITKH
jgi:hypothetical protein